MRMNSPYRTVASGLSAILESLLVNPTVAISDCGRLAFDAAWRLLADRGVVVRPRPSFGHNAVYEAAGYTVIGSYHPSRQNTNTGKLTAPMMERVFREAKRLLDE